MTAPTGFALRRIHPGQQSGGMSGQLRSASTPKTAPASVSLKRHSRGVWAAAATAGTRRKTR